MAGSIVVLCPEEDITGLRVLAHVEAGDQVVFEGDMQAEPWWPAAEPYLLWLLERQEEP